MRSNGNAWIPDASPMRPPMPVLAAWPFAVMVISDAASWASTTDPRAFHLRDDSRAGAREGLDRQGPAPRVAAPRARAFGSRLVVSNDCGSLPQCDGVHSHAERIVAAAARPAGRSWARRAPTRAASSMPRASAGLCVLGRVKRAASASLHRMGRVRPLAANRPMPVYAIGGLGAPIREAHKRGTPAWALLSATFS